VLALLDSPPAPVLAVLPLGAVLIFGPQIILVSLSLRFLRP
jgi:hypothetical protein